MRVNWWLFGVGFGLLLLFVYFFGVDKGWFVSVVWGNVKILVLILVGGSFLGFVFSLFYHSFSRIKSNGLGRLEGVDMVSQREAINILRYCYVEAFFPFIRDFGVPKSEWVGKGKPPLILGDGCVLEFHDVRSHSDKLAGKHKLSFGLFMSGGCRDGFSVASVTLDEGKDYLWNNFYGFFEENTCIGSSFMDKQGWTLHTPASERLKYVNLVLNEDIDADELKKIEALMPKDAVVNVPKKERKKEEKKVDDSKDDDGGVSGVVQELNADIEATKSRNKLRDENVEKV